MNPAQKGAVGELAVASHLMSLGYQVAFPFGTSTDWDLLMVGESGIDRVQVKYAKLADGCVPIRGYVTTHNGHDQIRVRSYSDSSFEWLAAYCPDTDECYYVPSGELGPSVIYLRVLPPKKSSPGIRWAKDYLTPTRI